MRWMSRAGPGLDLAAEEAGADDADVGLGAAVAAGAAVAVVAEDEPEGLRVGGGGGVEGREEAVAPGGGGGVLEGVAAVGVAGLVDAQDVDEGEAGGRGDGGEGRGGEALGAPLRQAVPRGVVDRLGAVKPKEWTISGCDSATATLSTCGGRAPAGASASPPMWYWTPDCCWVRPVHRTCWTGSETVGKPTSTVHGLAAGAEVGEVREPCRRGRADRPSRRTTRTRSIGGLEAGGRRDGASTRGRCPRRRRRRRMF
jgi:hypothetical protein